MAVDRFNRLFIAANFGLFVKMAGVKDKKNYLALIKKEKKLKKHFNNIKLKLITILYLGMDFIYNLKHEKSNC